MPAIMPIHRLVQQTPFSVAMPTAELFFLMYFYPISWPFTAMTSRLTHLHFHYLSVWKTARKMPLGRAQDLKKHRWLELELRRKELTKKIHPFNYQLHARVMTEIVNSNSLHYILEYFVPHCEEQNTNLFVHKKPNRYGIIWIAGTEIINWLTGKKLAKTNGPQLPRCASLPVHEVCGSINRINQPRRIVRKYTLRAACCWLLAYVTEYHSTHIRYALNIDCGAKAKKHTIYHY